MYGDVRTHVSARVTQDGDDVVRIGEQDVRGTQVFCGESESARVLDTHQIGGSSITEGDRVGTTCVCACNGDVGKRPSRLQRSRLRIGVVAHEKAIHVETL